MSCITWYTSIWNLDTKCIKYKWKWLYKFDCYTFGKERVCMRYCACWEEYALKSVGHQNILPQAFHCIGGSRLLSSYSYQTWLSYSKFDICLHSNLAHTARDLFRHKVGFHPLHSHNRRENHSLYKENKKWKFIIQ